MRKKGLTQGNPGYATLRFRPGHCICSNGKVKTPKSILLPTMIKSLPNNTELINVLNRLGHSVSHSTLMESQTENAFWILDHQLRSGCIIPKGCQAESFRIFEADNTDRNDQYCFISEMKLYLASLYSKCVFWLYLCRITCQISIIETWLRKIIQYRYTSKQWSEIDLVGLMILLHHQNERQAVDLLNWRYLIKMFMKAFHQIVLNLYQKIYQKLSTIHCYLLKKTKTTFYGQLWDIIFQKIKFILVGLA